MPSGATLKVEAQEDDSRVEFAFGGGLLRPLDGPLRAPAEGDHWLTVVSRDRAGNLSPPRWVRLRVDTVAPEIVLRAEPTPVEADGKAWVPPETVVHAQAHDALAGVARLELRVAGQDADGAPLSTNASELSAALTGPGEPGVTGPRTAQANAVDKVGNRAREVILGLNVDATPPSGELLATGSQTTNSDGLLVLAPDAQLEARLHDSESGLDAWKPLLDGSVTSQAVWSDLAALADGTTHQATAEARDRVGNSSRIGPLRFAVDAEGPEIRWTIRNPSVTNDEGHVYYQPPVILEAEALDALAGVETFERLENGAGTPFDQPIGINGPGVILRARDRVGNLSEERATWLIDRDPPQIRLIDHRGSHLQPGKLELRQGDVLRVEVRDPDSGLESSFHTVDDSLPMPVPESLVFPNSRGRVTLRIEAVDRFGQRAQAEWRIHVTGPGEDR